MRPPSTALALTVLAGATATAAAVVMLPVEAVARAVHAAHAPQTPHAAPALPVVPAVPAVPAISPVSPVRTARAPHTADGPHAAPAPHPAHPGHSGLPGHPAQAARAPQAAPHTARPPGPVAVPSCGTADAAEFPLKTRIHGGPADYPAGGEFRTWQLDLTNTTVAACRDIHPVLVLTDRDRTLRPTQIRAEFYDADARLWRPVAFEATDRAENVGVFDAPVLSTAVPSFSGFAVPAGRTLTVPVRLSFGADAAPDEVVVSAAVVQKRGGDGDWVGESGDYRLQIGPADPDAEASPDTDADAGRTADPSAPPARTAPAEPGDSELARTGRESAALRLAPVSAALLTAGGALTYLAWRRRRRPRPHP
ncbi:hypothetical protein [Streptomyces roseicoloratus]|uniref:Gram-positive cocci surface proteins LPxTG domain-containing protein n=1 Tax=Streptomyces roseicoloratus TaxID=2508722 RepID=A0ABY9RXE2_9ACTN|nr:hypothetical protein [Streptomyces roseicoloratus]WMX46857.1 hypothetical protein RGF97_21330 [Streptomyces roseicoloratus]